MNTKIFCACSDVNYLHSPFFSSFPLKTPARSAALKIAAMFGQTQTVERLLQGGANVNQQDKVRSMTVLHNVYGGH